MTSSSVLSVWIRVVLNVQESADRRVEALSQLETLVVSVEHRELLARSVDKLLPTLEQLLLDRTTAVRNGVTVLLGKIGAGCAQGHDRQVDSPLLKYVTWLEIGLAPQQSLEMKFLFLAVLKQFIEHSAAPLVGPFLPGILQRLQILLEETVQYELLPWIIAALQIISIKHTAHFTPHFQDIVDLLIGWRLHPSLPNHVSQVIEGAFLTFRQYWLSTLPFTYDLLGKFIVDMRSLPYETKSQETQNNSRLFSFLSCFSSIVQSIGPSFAQNGLYLVTQMFECFEYIFQKNPNKKWLLPANQCIISIAGTLANGFAPYLPTALTFFNKQLSLVPTEEYLVSVLSSEVQVLQHQGEVAPSLVASLFNNTMNQLRLHRSWGVSGTVLRVFGHIINGKSGASAASAARKLVMDNLQLMVESVHSYMDGKLGSDEILRGCLAGGSCDFFLLSFVEENVESLMNDLMDKFHPMDNTVIAHFLPLQLSHVEALRRLSSKHWTLWPPETQKKLLGIILSSVSLSPKSVKETSLEWMKSLFLNKESICLDSLDIEQFLDVLIKLAHNEEADLRVSAASLLETMLSLHFFNLTQCLSITQASLIRLGDIQLDVRHGYLNLLAQASLSAFLLPIKLKSQVLCKRRTSNSGGQLRLHHFQRLMTFMSQRQRETEPSYAWVIDTFNLYEKPLTTENNDKISNLLSPSFIVAFLWATSECAKFCIMSRLRTPISSPVQTFEAIERAVVSASLGDQSEMGATSWRQLPGRLVLEFVEQLEKKIHQSEGNIHQMNQAQRNNAVFFRANRKVCEDWFARMRPSLVAASAMCRSFSCTIRHSFHRISSLMQTMQNNVGDPKKENELQTALVHLAMAFCSQHATDEIQGLIVWTERHLHWSSRTGPLLVALRGLMWQSKGSYEEAIRQFRLLLNQDQLDVANTQLLQFIVNQVTKCYLKLGDWTTMEAWLEDLKSFQAAQDSEEYKKALETSMDSNYILAMTSFNQGNIPQAANSLRSCAEIPSGGQPSSEPLFRLHASEQLLFQAMLDIGNRGEVLKLSKQMIEEPLKVATVDSLFEAEEFLIQLQCINLLEKPDSASALSESLFANAHRTSRDIDIGLLNKLLQTGKFVAERMHKPFPVQKLVSCMSTVARKQSNYSLAERLLLQQQPPNLVDRVKLLHHQGKKVQAIALLSNYITAQEDSLTKDLAKSLIRLGSWISSEIINPQDTTSTAMELSSQECFQRAVEMDPGASKGWLFLGDWFHNTAFQTISRLSASSGHPPTLLTDEERDQLASILKGLHVEGTNSLQELTEATITQHVIDFFNAGHHLEHQNHPDAIPLIIRRTLPLLSKSSIDELATLWISVRRRTLQFFVHAARNYSQFLCLADKTSTLKARSIAATLRIFRLLVKYGSDFPGEFSDIVSNTPSSSWKDIVPQLFALIDHPDEYVRGKLGQLILKIGVLYPELIVYPAAVGKLTEDATNSLNDISSFAQILNGLKEQNPELISEVQSMIQELTRMTSLWEEQCLTILQYVYPQVNSRLRAINEELSRVSSDKVSLTWRDIYHTMMQPVITKLDDLSKVTSRTPETWHERWFQRTFGEALRKAIIEFKNPSQLEGFENCWLPLKELLKEFSAFLKPTALKLNKVSPKLSKWKSSMVPMPGVQGTSASVFIQSFDNSILILPTKTRPKKITAIGSNGQKYAYLLKGTEDLHLDERIMQFLSIANQILAHNQSSIELQSRNYAVIPLGKRSGLIQWVDGATPLFTLYKQWQRREMAAKSYATGSTPLRESFRPTEMFYSKIIPALKDKGIVDITSRSDWPLDVMKKVFMELSMESPKSLLSKEFWATTQSTAEWWEKTQRYSRSIAVMSIIGYILGLGDRHLDNILIDVESGEVVHIDYNICFEKGLRLKVPERVPFRMTQVLQDALGLTGVEGAYRKACEYTLRALRTNRETLLTLLEAFVYDPLVDWTSDKVDETRKGLELSVHLTLVRSRIDDAAQQMSDFSNMLHNILPERIETVQGMDQSDREQHQLSSIVDMPIHQSMSEVTAIEENAENQQLADGRLFLAKTLQPVLSIVVKISERSEQTSHIQSFAMKLKDVVSSLENELDCFSPIDTEGSVNPQLHFKKLMENADQICVGLAALAKMCSDISAVWNQKEHDKEDRTEPEMEPQEALSTEEHTGTPEGQMDSKDFKTDLSNTLSVFPSQSNSLYFMEGNDKNHRAIDEENSSRVLKSAAQNVHAINVLKRIQDKLEGRDFYEGAELSVEEQVAFAIKESTSIDNLSVMYEGWTGWI